MHLSFDHYLATLRGRYPFLVLYRQALQHLKETCTACRSRLPDLPPAVASEATPAGHPDPSVPLPLPDDRREVSLDELAAAENLLARSRQAARFAREDLKRILRLPVAQWQSRVEGARTRFRSRSFVELLIEESMARVRTSSRDAAVLAGLVPLALRRIPQRLQGPWARVLEVRAAAHQANALRVAGDLRAAQATFSELRSHSATLPVHDPVAQAEIDSLEASLQTDLSRFDAAGALLERAARAYHLADEHLGLAKTLLKQANLVTLLGQAERVSPLLERAAELIDPEDQPFLHFCIVHGRISALLDLDRPREASELLAAERGLYLSTGDPYSAAVFAGMQARSELGLSHFDAAEAGFTAARDQFLALDRDYDAILASLYLADTLLAAGKLPALRHLAADLVPLFQSRGVERETLASLRLLAEAAKAETLSAALLAELRHKLDPGVSSAGALQRNL